MSKPAIIINEKTKAQLKKAKSVLLVMPSRQLLKKFNTLAYMALVDFDNIDYIQTVQEKGREHDDAIRAGAIDYVCTVKNSGKIVEFRQQIAF